MVSAAAIFASQIAETTDTAVASHGDCVFTALAETQATVL